MEGGREGKGEKSQKLSELRKIEEDPNDFRIFHFASRCGVRERCWGEGND
jgi:hypothetical protein